LISIRRQILDAFAASLAKATNWGLVHTTRIQNVRQVWPYLMVYSTGDAIEQIVATDPNIYLRSVDVVVVGMLRLSDWSETEERMDALSLEVEQRITSEAIRALVPQIQSMELVSTALDIVITEDDAIDHAEVTVNFRVVCANSENDPSVLI
jgi:hypothetical protein